MKVYNQTFNSLTSYLAWLQREWDSFEWKLYTLEEYLTYGQYYWLEVLCLPKEKAE